MATSNNKIDIHPTNQSKIHQPNLKKERAVFWSALVNTLSFVIVAIHFFSIPALISNGLNFNINIVIATFFLIGAAVSFSICFGFMRQQPNLRLIILFLVLAIPFILASLFYQQASIYAGFAALIYSLLIGTAAGYEKSSEIAVPTGIILSACISVMEVLSPLSRANNPVLPYFLIGIAAAYLITYITLIFVRLITATIRVKLISFSLAMVLIPFILISYLNIQTVQNTSLRQNQESIIINSQNQKQEIANFIDDNLKQISLDASFPIFANYLTSSYQERQTGSLKEELASTINTLYKLRQESKISNFGLIDEFGTVLYDTNREKIYQTENNVDYFKIPSSTGEPYMSQILYGKDGSSFFVFSSPVKDESGQVVGIIRIQYDASILNQLLPSSQTLFGDKSYSVLIDENYIRVIDTLHPELNHEPIIPLSPDKLEELKRDKKIPATARGGSYAWAPALEEIIQNRELGAYFTKDIDLQPDQIEEAGAIQTINYRKQTYYLIYFQRQNNLIAFIQQQANTLILNAILITTFVSFFAIFMSEVISRPIRKLSVTAEKITAGDLNAYASVNTRDEFSFLANSFNTMTERLRNLISNLEQRVADRTQELENQNQTLVFRSKQLRTISEVAQNIASVQNLDMLFSQITDLISERFGFYHIGIFLLDERGEYAVLRAANSQGGKKMLARQHKLKVGQVGLVGYATGSGKPRIATDVGEDSVYFNNPDLPETRSEMALPLSSGQKTIGALDVQSKVSNAFSPEDIELFSILADQIAIAITNNNLLAETARALIEMQSLHQKYLKQEWAKETAKKEQKSFLYTSRGISAQEKLTLPEIEQVVETGEPYLEVSTNNGSKNPVQTMAVPIRLRGETIGVIHLKEENQNDISWGESEINTVQKVSEQIAVALENARLFEQTVRRAERERKVLEITSAIRATNDPDKMIEIAVNALQQHLGATKAQVILNKTRFNPENL